MLAKNNDVVSRSDLADNEYSAKDPRLVTINKVAGKGETPVALNFQQAFNAPNSPWLTLVRNAVLGDGDAVDADNDEITAVLSAVAADAAAGVRPAPPPPAASRRPHRKAPT